MWSWEVIACDQGCGEQIRTPESRSSKDPHAHMGMGGPVEGGSKVD